MWRDHFFSQRNRTTKGTVGMGFGSWRVVGGGGVGWCGGLYKIGVLAPLCHLYKETLIISHPPIIIPPPPRLIPCFLPISSKNFLSPHYSLFWKKSGEEGLGLWTSLNYSYLARYYNLINANGKNWLSLQILAFITFIFCRKHSRNLWKFFHRVKTLPIIR